MSDPSIRPVFYASSPRRWKRILALARLGIFLFLAFCTVAALGVLWEKYPTLPRLSSGTQNFHALLNPTLGILESHRSKDFRKTRHKLGVVGERDSVLDASRKRDRTAYGSHPLSDQIRAGFYVNWDAGSFQSLQENIDHLNMVFPEWMFVPDTGDRVVADIDPKALALLRAHRTATVPMVSNYFHEKWNGENVARVIRSSQSRAVFIASVVSVLEQYDFRGVNIDFEDLGVLKTDENLVAFQKELYQALHAKGLIVTQDVAPFNTDYSPERLAAWNDYLVLMAYDQHNAESVAGPVAAQKWVEAAIDDICQNVPGSKVIVGLAAYGYDWPKGGAGTDLTYQEAMVTAGESEGNITWDDDGYNLHFSYDDDDSLTHHVWFVDAATSFNAMRAAGDAGTAGTALWRLGSEDPRLWTFYDRDLSRDSMRSRAFDPANLHRIRPGTAVDFEGEGEILDLVSSPDTGTVRVEWDSVEALVAEEDYRKLPSSYVVRKFGKAVGKRVYLTFDDGPDAEWTPKILDILEREKVPATFFLIGRNAEQNPWLTRRIYREGFTIGNHTFNHPNIAKVSPERARLELEATRRLIECLTDHSTVIFRPPYNADAEPQTLEEIVPLAIGKEDHYYMVGESIDPLDWQKDVSADSLLARVQAQIGIGSVILLHDAGGDREATVKALPRIISWLRSQGYAFGDVSDLVGKSRDDLMPALPPGKDRWFATFDLLFSQALWWIQSCFFALFFLGVVLALVRTFAMAVLAAIRRRQGRRQILSAERPPVSVIVPGYNEEVTAVKTVRNLLQSRYPDFEIVFVDDGSKDRTLEVVREAFASEPRVLVLTKPNGGKASALNLGIAQATHGILVCIDADTVLEPDALERLVEQFITPEVVAVAGNVKVGNERSILTRWQSIEYITSQNFDRRAFDLLGCITVIPGAIGAFRREAINEVGGFTTDTLAEDCDLTLRLLRNGGVVRHAPSAIAWTEAPETLAMFLRQRFRWSFGILQSFWKHREVLVDLTPPSLPFVAWPNMIVFQVLLPLLSPVVDLIMVLAIAGGQAQKVLVYYGLFLVVDLTGAIIAFRFERESLGRLWLLVPQRIVYRYLLWWALVRAVMRALQGQMQGWGVLKRTGSVANRG